MTATKPVRPSDYDPDRASRNLAQAIEEMRRGLAEAFDAQAAAKAAGLTDPENIRVVMGSDADAAGSDADAAEAIRGQYVRALTAIAPFVRLIGEEQWARELVGLAIALNNLSFGETRFFLRASVSGHREKDITEEWLVKAQLAIALEAMVTGGMTIPNAAARIDRHRRSREFHIILNRDSTLRAVLPKWRRHFQNERGTRDEIANNQYKLWRQEIEAQASLLPPDEMIRIGDKWVEAAADDLFRITPDMRGEPEL